MPTLFDALIAFLEESGWPGVPIEGHPAVRLIFDGEHGQWPCVARVRQDEQQLIFYSICPFDIPAPRRAAAMELVTRLNYGLVIGNFELDLDDGEVRFKTSLEVVDGPPGREVIKRLVATNLQTMDRHLLAFTALVTTDMAVRDVLAQIPE